MKDLIKFIKLISGYFRFYRDYGYTGINMEFIIQNYTKVLCNRTKSMSKPIYYAEDVINQLDEYYDEYREENNSSTMSDVVELLNIIKKKNPKQEIVLSDNEREIYYIKLRKATISVGVEGELVIERE